MGVGVREQLETSTLGNSLQVGLAVSPTPRSRAGICQAGGMRGEGLPILTGTRSAVCGVSLPSSATTQPPRSGMFWDG